MTSNARHLCHPKKNCGDVLHADDKNSLDACFDTDWLWSRACPRDEFGEGAVVGPVSRPVGVVALHTRLVLDRRRCKVEEGK